MEIWELSGDFIALKHMKSHSNFLRNHHLKSVPLEKGGKYLQVRETSFGSLFIHLEY